jgi:hypothetical protein
MFFFFLLLRWKLTSYERSLFETTILKLLIKKYFFFKRWPTDVDKKQYRSRKRTEFQNIFEDSTIVVPFSMNFNRSLAKPIFKSGSIRRVSGKFGDPYTLKALYMSLVWPKLEYAGVEGCTICLLMRTGDIDTLFKRRTMACITFVFHILPRKAS